MSESTPIPERVLAVIARETQIEPSKLRADATLPELNVDSVDVVMILNGLEEEFGVYLSVEQSLSQVRNLGEFVALIARLVTPAHVRSA